MSYILSVKMLDPEFKGQTKDSLNSRTCIKLVFELIHDNLTLWLNDNPEVANEIVEISVKSAEERLKQNSKIDKKKYDSKYSLPIKLTDCKTTDRMSAEIYLVEGDSAGVLQNKREIKTIRLSCH